MTTDIVIDTLDTLIDLLRANGAQVLPAQRLEAERIVRAAWGGDRVYIAKLGESGQRQISERDAAIARDFRRGAAVELLCRRYALSRRRVQQILALDRDAAPAAPGAAGEAACLTRCAEPADTAARRQGPARKARAAA